MAGAAGGPGPCFVSAAVWVPVCGVAKMVVLFVPRQKQGKKIFLPLQEMLGRMQMIKRVASSGKAAMAAGGVVAAGASFKLLSSFAQVPDWGVLRRAPAIGAISARFRSD